MADDQVAVVKQANDIVEVIGEYVSLKKRGRTYQGLCPFHDDHNPSMTVDPTRQNFRCWSCGKFGDVITFVQERERVEFWDALEILARRANIPLRRGRRAIDTQGRVRMLDMMEWAKEQYAHHLLDAASAKVARDYLAARSLSGETIQRYGLGYAPDSWEWLTQRALRAGWPAELLVQVGLSAPRENDGTYYDRFRDRVVFPIRDVRGRTVGFGGRILPSSSSSANAPKYYNSSDTPLFSKSENLYGLDQARPAAEKAGYLAVVEGYTDVLMAHQLGVLPVVATLGTALNERHIRQLRRWVPRVILVFDADTGGLTGMDRALELFVREGVELQVAALPEGLDPCDLLLQAGHEAFQQVLSGAVDALEFKLSRTFTREQMATVEGQRRAMDSVLEVIARVPELPDQAVAVKRELVITSIERRLGIREKVIWDRLNEMRREQRPALPAEVRPLQVAGGPRQGRPNRAEKELLEVLLAEPEFVGRAEQAIAPEDINHPGLQRMLREMYALHAAGELATVDRLRVRLADNARLADSVLRLQAGGLTAQRRAEYLQELLREFDRRRAEAAFAAKRNQLRDFPSDGPPPLELLRQMQEIQPAEAGRRAKTQSQT